MKEAERAVPAGIILAAGKGTRMKSRTPKVMHHLLGRPMVRYPVDLMKEAGVPAPVAVLGHECVQVEDYVKDLGCRVVYQTEQLGTAHAVLCAREALRGFEGPVLIVCGDTPLLTTQTVGGFIRFHKENRNSLSILSARLPEPSGYGRILRAGSSGSEVLGIVEEKDATADQKRINEINTGTYVAEAAFLFPALRAVDCSNAQGEYYLTDIVSHGVKMGCRIGAFSCSSPEEAMGVNSRWDLAAAENILLGRLKRQWMAKGVTFELWESTYVDADVIFGQDVIVGPSCVLKGRCRIGTGAVIGPFCLLKDAQVPEGGIVPPYTRLIPGG